MMHFFKRSLRRKLIVMVTAVASLTVLIASTGLGAYEWQQARKAVFEQEYAASQMTADSSAAALLFGDKSAATETLAALHSNGRVQLACLYDRQGQLMSSLAAPYAQQSTCPEAARAKAVFTLRHLSIVRPVAVKNNPVGLLYLDISLAELQRLALSLVETVLLATLLATAFALLVSSLTERWVSQPVVDLTHTALQIAEEGNRTLRARRTSDDEVGLLIDQFNAMLDRLHEREGELRESYEQLEMKVQERTQDLRDEIAERKLVELDLSHAKDLAEQANRAKSAFLANMSHEFRTPLNAIIGYSEMLYEDAQQDAHEGMQSDLAKVLSSARHLLGLISDILDLSKIEAGQMTVHFEDLPVSDLIADVLPIAEVLVKANRNVLRIENRAAHAENRVDALRFRQCLLNLLGNASKFTQDGTITLRTEVQQRNGADWVVWSIRDTGIGIAAENLPKLFRSFSQVDASAARRHGGSGLGLCISQELAHAMGGSIEAESELHVGSTFRLWLPLQTSGTAPNNEPAELEEVAELSAV